MNKEKLSIIVLILLIPAIIIMYCTGDFAYANNDDKVFKVLKFNYDEEVGYTPIGETSMKMDQLRSWIKICYFTSERIGSNIIIIFEADVKERWIIKINDRAVIKELNKIEQEYELKCEIPD